MRTIALRTKTVLAALAGAGVIALGTAAAVPGTGVERDLAHFASALPGGQQPHSGPALADDKTPGMARY